MINDEGFGLYENFDKKDSPTLTEFSDFFPSETRGDGKIRKNNLRDGSAQGKASFILKVSCRICGFMADINKVDHSGGSIDGNGAGGQIVTAVATSKTNNGTIHTENYGTQTYSLNAGCPLCFSKNSTLIRRQITAGNPWDRVRNNLGF